MLCHAPAIDLDKIRDPKRLKGRWCPAAIEWVVDLLHNSLRYHHGDALPVDPAVVFELLGFSVEAHETLGYLIGEGGRTKVAGVIDGHNHTVRYSRAFRRPVQRFTLAHEIGHVVLHSPMTQHRDRPVHGAGGQPRRCPKEAEADLFAAQLLMPKEWVRESFRRRFLTSQFELNDATAFALSRANVCDVRHEFTSRRTGARKLATAIHFNGDFFESLCEQFGVSPEAMAIRLEELDLLAERHV